MRNKILGVIAAIGLYGIVSGIGDYIKYDRVSSNAIGSQSYEVSLLTQNGPTITKPKTIIEDTSDGKFLYTDYNSDNEPDKKERILLNLRPFIKIRTLEDITTSDRTRIGELLKKL